MLKEGKSKLFVFVLFFSIIITINFTQSVAGQSSCIFFADPIFPHFGSPDNGSLSANDKLENYIETLGIKEQVESILSSSIQSQDASFSPLVIQETYPLSSSPFELEIDFPEIAYNDEGFAFLIEPDGMGNFQYYGIGVPCPSGWGAKKLAEYDEVLWQNLYKAPLRYQKFITTHKKIVFQDSIPMVFVDALLDADGSSCSILGFYEKKSRSITFKVNHAIIENYVFTGTFDEPLISDLPKVLAHEIGHSFILGHNWWDNGLFDYSIPLPDYESHNLMTQASSVTIEPFYFTESQSCLVRRLCHNPGLMRSEVIKSVGAPGYGLTTFSRPYSFSSCGDPSPATLSLLEGFSAVPHGRHIDKQFSNESCEVLFASGIDSNGNFKSGINNYFTSNCELDNPLDESEFVEFYGLEDNKYKEWCYKELSKDHPYYVPDEITKAVHKSAKLLANSCRKVEFCGDGFFDEDVEECDPSAYVSSDNLPNPSCENEECFPEQGQVCLMEGEGVDKQNCIADSVCFDDVMLVIDRSGSMRCSVSLDGQGCFESEVQCNACGGIWNGPINDAKAASIQFVESVNLNISRIGVTSFADSAGLDAPLTNDSEILINAINAIEAGGGTDIASGINTGGIGLELFETPENNKTMILLSDGDQNSGDASSAANALKDLGVEIYAIGLGDANQALLQDIASDAEHYFYSPSSGELEQIFEEIAECSPEFHNGCYGNYCIVIPGPGDDECNVNADCT